MKSLWDLIDSITPAQLSIIDAVSLRESSYVSDTINKKENGKKKQYWLGAYDTAEAAHHAYKAGAIKIHGSEWAKH